MITKEMAMTPMANRGLSAEELDLKRYAASELRGDPRCLKTGLVEKKTRRLISRAPGEDRSQEPPSSYSARA